MASKEMVETASIEQKQNEDEEPTDISNQKSLENIKISIPTNEETSSDTETTSNFISQRMNPPKTPDSDDDDDEDEDTDDDDMKEAFGGFSIVSAIKQPA